MKTQECTGVDWWKIGKYILDTACSRTMVQRALVPGHKYPEGDAMTIMCAHRDTVFYPFAKIDMVVDGMPIEVEAAVSETYQCQFYQGQM